MVKKNIILLGLIMLFASTVPAFGQSDNNKGAEPGSQNSNLLQSELSSATAGPFVITGYAGFGQLLGDCVKDTACQTTSTEISWSGSVPSGNAPTTLTVTFSSAAPGPFQFCLSDEATPPAQSDPEWVTVDNSNPIYNSTTTPGLVPANPKVNTYVHLQSYGYWSPPSDTAYPWLQWAPISVTLVYQ